MTVRLNKPWKTLEPGSLTRIGGQLGVYELADSKQQVRYIGVATARDLFGLKGELEARIGTAEFFRFEITSAYQTRFRELLMAHFADHGQYPEDNNGDETRNLGRLSP